MKQMLFTKKQIIKHLEDISTNFGFGVRSEFESSCSSDDYIQGYIKGVTSALTNLEFDSQVVSKVKQNLLDYRQSLFSDNENEEN